MAKDERKRELPPFMRWRWAACPNDMGRCPEYRRFKRRTTPLGRCSVCGAGVRTAVWLDKWRPRAGRLPNAGGVGMPGRVSENWRLEQRAKGEKARGEEPIH